MRSSMDDLAGLRLVIAGEDVVAVQPVHDRLAAQGADVRVRVGDLDTLVRALADDPPEAIVAHPRIEDELRARLDPLGLETGPPVISDPAAVRATVEIRRLRARQRELGLGARDVGLIGQAAPLHDIGKIAIPDSILLKPGRLTEEEFEVIKTHAVLGARVLAGGASDLFAIAETIARHHHERWDGDGYPRGLAAEAIPVAARIVHLADVYDVLVHERPYRESLTPAAAAEEIQRGSGSDFDPTVVEVFEKFSLQV